MRIALVLGGAACVWDDVEAALNLGEFDGAVGCNNIGVVWPGRFDAWVTLHGEKLRLWAARRRLRGLPPHEALIGQDDVPARFPGQKNPGSSGLYALKVAIDHLGFDRAVLCGIPLEPEAAHFDDGRTWRAATQYHDGWRQALPYIRDRARSMGGWTAELLGRPDQEWLNERP